MTYFPPLKCLQDMSSKVQKVVIPNNQLPGCLGNYPGQLVPSAQFSMHTIIIYLPLALLYIDFSLEIIDGCPFIKTNINYLYCHLFQL